MDHAFIVFKPYLIPLNICRINHGFVHSCPELLKNAVGKDLITWLPNHTPCRNLFAAIREVVARPQNIFEYITTTNNWCIPIELSNVVLASNHCQAYFLSVLYLELWACSIKPYLIPLNICRINHGFVHSCPELLKNAVGKDLITWLPNHTPCRNLFAAIREVVARPQNIFEYITTTNNWCIPIELSNVVLASNHCQAYFLSVLYLELWACSIKPYLIPLNICRINHGFVHSCPELLKNAVGKDLITWLPNHTPCRNLFAAIREVVARPQNIFEYITTTNNWCIPIELSNVVLASNHCQAYFLSVLYLELWACSIKPYLIPLNICRINHGFVHSCPELLKNAVGKDLITWLPNHTPCRNLFAAIREVVARPQNIFEYITTTNNWCIPIELSNVVLASNHCQAYFLSVLYLELWACSIKPYLIPLNICRINHGFVHSCPELLKNAVGKDLITWLPNHTPCRNLFAAIREVVARPQNIFEYITTTNNWCIPIELSNVVLASNHCQAYFLSVLYLELWACSIKPYLIPLNICRINHGFVHSCPELLKNAVGKDLITWLPNHTPCRNLFAAIREVVARPQNIFEYITTTNNWCIPIELSNVVLASNHCQAYFLSVLYLELWACSIKPYLIPLNICRINHGFVHSCPELLKNAVGKDLITWLPNHTPCRNLFAAIREVVARHIFMVSLFLFDESIFDFEDRTRTHAPHQLVMQIVAVAPLDSQLTSSNSNSNTISISIYGSVSDSDFAPASICSQA
ncbi:uncharacterized protein LOC124460393 [Drosophila willistoni]|uniref:uncharacterized protein LOC124460393 n=1 Tax=Drosophila willistoni TaxID=7260 RepID=UPI001F07B5CB|nr:uncharacterized protein LOC124460393 [Drosophila willistoni]